MASPNSALPLGPVFSWSRSHGGLVYTAGHAAVSPETGRMSPGTLAQETRLTLENLARTLATAGSSMGQVLKVTAYLTDMANFKEFNAVYAEFFSGPTPPARTCVEVPRLPYNFRVEIDVVAVATGEKV